VLIERRPFDDSELAALVVDQQVELQVDAFGLDPVARYLVAVVGGDAVACGALHSLDIDTAEIKQMYVRPAYRGRGIAGRMLAALESLARSRGHTVVRLETGVYLPGAISLYLGAGYHPIARFEPHVRDASSRCFAKSLDGSDPVRVVRRSSSDPSVVSLVDSVDAAARFVVALVGGDVAAGCGAIRPLDDQTVEITSMYVRPAYRGGGLARRLLTALEDMAAGSHYRLVRVSAGSVGGLYESSGYQPIPAYGSYADNLDSRCYEKLVIATEPIASESTWR
jgi:GNAT superfamily N-acetyltransferase